MRFKTDENLHPELAVFLRENGHDALTVWDEQRRGRPDTDLAALCQLEQRALVTLDIGFADIRVYPLGSTQDSSCCELRIKADGAFSKSFPGYWPC